MHYDYIDLLLNLPDIHCTQIQDISENISYIEVCPNQHTQACPVCKSDKQVIRKGKNKTRKIRHTRSFNKITYLLAPAIRLFCKNCQVGFVWQYSFASAKKQYSSQFEQRCISLAEGATVKKSAELQYVPISTVERMVAISQPEKSCQLQEQAWQEAKNQANLVLGVDDFAIRKGHTYNTGIHNLKGETMLDILPGRKLEDLRTYSQKHPEFLELKPKAVVMDLAPTYHTWIAESFPTAIRIADRFHVQRYVIDALQLVRKEVQRTLAVQAKKHLKANHHLLNPRSESISDANQQILHELLGYSTLLRQVYEWKEAFNEWYDYSPDVRLAEIRFDRWCEQGEQLNNSAVTTCLRTMRKWRSEIINYHRCRWTNATVEGRHNRIKAFQRRHYFTRNQNRYVHGILIECNRKLFTEKFSQALIMV